MIKQFLFFHFSHLPFDCEQYILQIQKNSKYNFLIVCAQLKWQTN